MIQYKSTRGNKKLYSFSQALLKGIAPDGGLLIPEKIPQINNAQLKLLSGKIYQEIASCIFELFQTGIPKTRIKKIINKAYSDNFDDPSIAPLIDLKNNQYILELWHGPTSAFKDMALQIMPLFFSEAINKSKKPFRYLILVATSGDTGKAALEGFRDKENISIMVFYPETRVSQLQELQMKTQAGKNVAIYAVQGDFDTVQTMIKEIFNDKKFNKKIMNLHHTILSSANSINWGRLIPQIVYHIKSYINLTDRQVIKLGQSIDIAVPSGNFGNLLAAYYAKSMGLPINKFICASNSNNALTGFLKTGIYDIKNRRIIQTPSPSMDILIASNIERLLYAITRDPEKISAWMRDLKTKRKFEVDPATKAILQKKFYAGWVSNEECLRNIKKIYTETKYLMDPHTSVAQLVEERYIKEKHISSPIIICSTAHWAKFPKDIYKSLSKTPEKSFSNDFDILNAVSELAPGSPIPKNIEQLKVKTIKHNGKCKADLKIIEKIIIEELAAL